MGNLRRAWGWAEKGSSARAGPLYRQHRVWVQAGQDRHHMGTLPTTVRVTTSAQDGHPCHRRAAQPGGHAVHMSREGHPTPLPPMCLGPVHSRLPGASGVA